jgi:hypothetical protein
MLAHAKKPADADDDALNLTRGVDEQFVDVAELFIPWAIRVTVPSMERFRSLG